MTISFDDPVARCNDATVLDDLWTAQEPMGQKLSGEDREDGSVRRNSDQPPPILRPRCQGAAYAAPAVLTLAVPAFSPDEAEGAEAEPGQTGGMKMMMRMKMMKMMMM